ncbi:MAG TPA: hypothetical protein ENG60_03660 [Thermoplasmatales archaeon]|nr:hypothetical protein [Thermoplasmatales archaeon]HEX17486.1 hypothetical protein [Thermoplasmatales archaeon]
MSIKDLVSKMEEEAEREIEDILSKAREERSRILEEERRKMEREKIERMRKIERELENRKRAEIARIRRGLRSEILRLKERIIEECMKEGLSLLERIPEGDYEEKVEKLMRRVKEEIGDDCRIIPSRDVDVKIAKKLGLKVDGKRIDSKGGFIAVSRDGKITIDNRFEKILERKEKEIRTTIGRELFGGERSWI